jgi:hypothetical protein
MGSKLPYQITWDRGKDELPQPWQLSLTQIVAWIVPIDTWQVLPVEVTLTGSQKKSSRSQAMKTKLLTDKYQQQLEGVLHCYDRIVLSGMLQRLGHAYGMTSYLYEHHIRIFDYAQFAQPFREAIVAHANALAQEHDLKIQFIRKKNFRKEDALKAILLKRGTQPGLVHIFSAMEMCNTYRPWHDKRSGKTYLKPDRSKCLHYYFYFIDAQLGLCYLRVPTWCPFHLQFYFNGHAWLAAQLKARGIAYTLRDNAFEHIEDYELANQLAQDLQGEALLAKLNEFVHYFCPALQDLQTSYYWTIAQAEFATDLIFKERSALQAFYPHLLETLIHAVKPEDIATFLGQKLHPLYQGELGNHFKVRWLGTRLKHQMGPVALKLYDKFGLILRIETTVNDVSFFKQYREVVHRNGEREMTWARMRKSLFSLTALQTVLVAANRRYLEFISDIETPEAGITLLNHLTHTKVVHQHSYKGLNFLSEEDAGLLRVLLRGEYMISGITNKALRQHFPGKTSGQISRLLKRLRVLGLIKKVGPHYKYYLTHLGRQSAVLAVKLREMYVIPYFSYSKPEITWA